MERDISTRLIEWRQRPRRKPLILRGARQVGKTYSLLAFGQHHFPTFHYVNFERDERLAALFVADLNPMRILRELSFYFDRAITAETDLLIFDEIQQCPQALTSLKYFQEEIPQLAVCAAGSLLGVELGDGSFPVGKVELLNMFPLSLPEFLLGVGEERSYKFLRDLAAGDTIPEIVHSRLWSLLKTYMAVGGLPEAVKTYGDLQDDPYAAFQAVRKVQSDLITTYVADMAKHSGKINSMHLERLWANVPAQLAREQDGSASKFKVKDVIPDIRGYERLANVIDWLEKAGLIIKVKIVNSGKFPFAAHTKENFFKLYCFDTGLLGALGNLPVKAILNYDFGTYKGYMAENFVAQEFMCAEAGELYSWQEATAEVEFLREVEGEILPIEVKSGWVTQAKSLKVFAQKYNPSFRTIMSGKNLFLDTTNQIHHYPLYLACHFPLPATVSPDRN